MSKMKFLVILILLCAGSILMSAQSMNEGDSHILKARLEALKKDKSRIEEEIKREDAKRNKEIAGVSEESMEQINDRQDSICLSLRSKLIDRILEIKELTAKSSIKSSDDKINNNHKSDSIKH